MEMNDAFFWKKVQVLVRHSFVNTVHLDGVWDS
jgi:hypothetical protein